MSTNAAFESAVTELRKAIRGEIILPHEEHFERFCALYNGIHSHRPCVLIRARGASDAQAAVRFATAFDLAVAAKGGGHGVAGYALSEGGVTIDFSLMRSVHVDARERTVRVDPGALWSDVDTELESQGLCMTGGTFAGTGVAGLALGGGYGWQMSLHGYVADHVLELEVVTADGQLLRASRQEHPDLFWAMRGAGHALAIVTSFLFRVHPLPAGGLLNCTLMTYPIQRAAQVLHTLSDLLSQNTTQPYIGAALFSLAPFNPSGTVRRPFTLNLDGSF